METYNCLVTELKASTGNTDLPKFNTLPGKIEVPQSNLGSYNIPSGIEVTITILGDNDIAFNSEGTQKTKTLVGTGSEKYFYIYGTTGAMADIEVENPYYITEMTAWAPNISAFKYQTERTNLEFSTSETLTGNIEELERLISLTNINIGKNPVIGSVNSLAQKMVDNGRTSGTMDIWKNGNTTGVKVNNENFGHAIVVFADGSFTATKES